MRTKQVSLSSTMLLMFYKRWLEGDTSLNRTEHGLCLCINHFVQSHYAKDVHSPRWYDDMVNSLLYEMRCNLKKLVLVLLIHLTKHMQITSLKLRTKCVI